MSVYLLFILGLPAGLLLGWFIGWFGVPVKRPPVHEPTPVEAPPPTAPVATTLVPGADAPAEQLWARPATAVAPSDAVSATDETAGLKAVAGDIDLVPAAALVPVDEGSPPAGTDIAAPGAPAVVEATTPEPPTDAGLASPTESFEAGAAESAPMPLQPPPGEPVDEEPGEAVVASLLGERGTLDIEQVEGIGRVYAGRLREAGIATIAALFAAAATDYRRRKLAEELRISRKLILRWVNHADLMRIDGIDTQFAELLEAAGVDSPTELQHRVPAHLAARMAEVDAEKHIAPEVPDEATVANWVEAAKTLPKLVSH